MIQIRCTDCGEKGKITANFEAKKVYCLRKVKQS
jgi:hypothetical protein